jgi:hypothetical protein
VSDKKRKSAKEMASALVKTGDPGYRHPLVSLLVKACAELERRISLEDGEGGLDSIELIGTVKTAAAILVEADALLGDDTDPAA